MQITPRPEPRSCSAFASEATIRPPVAANGCPAASEPPLTLSFARSIAPSGSSRPSFSRANTGSRHAFSVASTCAANASWISKRSKSADAEPVAVEHPRHRVGGRHQQPLALVHVVDGRGLRVDEVGQDRQPALAPPTPRDASSTAEAPSVNGVELPAVIVPFSPPNTGLSFASFSTDESGAQVLVALEPEVRGHEAVEEPALVGRGHVRCDAAASSSCSARVTPQSSAISAACSPIESPVRGSALRGISGTTCAGRSRVSVRARAGQRLRAVEVEQDVAQVLVDRDRRVRGGVHAARDPDVDLPQRDLVGDRDHGLQARPARLLEVVGGRLGRQLGAEHATRA